MRWTHTVVHVLGNSQTNQQIIRQYLVVIYLKKCLSNEKSIERGEWHACLSQGQKFLIAVSMLSYHQAQFQRQGYNNRLTLEYRLLDEGNFVISCFP